MLDVPPARSEPALLLEEFLPYRLAVLAHAVSRALADVYTQNFGLSIPEWRILANLGRFGPLNAGELAERSSMDKPKVTRALQRLEARGLTQRKTEPSDRRQVRLALTRRGKATFRQIASLALDWQAKLTASLEKEERIALDRILSKLARRSEELRSNSAQDAMPNTRLSTAPVAR
jgi:DNA-binding MarR family transcriptional regulator